MSSPSTTEVCFNSNCREPSGQWKRGWRRRTGDYANLCDRCASVYEGGRFCETFHLTASGWRCCESCGKQIHCGCIVSFHMFVLLDAGGIECLTCARRSYILTPNPAWPPPLHFLPSQPERMKDLSMKTWNSIAGSGPVPWRQAPSLFNGSEIQSNVPLRMPFGLNISGVASRQCVYDRLSTASPELKQEPSYERMGNENLRFGHSGTLPNGKTELFFKEPPCPFVTDIKPVFKETDYASSTMNMDLASSSKIDINECKHVAFDTTDPPRILIPEGKQRYWHSGMGSFGELPICSVKAHGDGQGRNQLIPRYHPQITVQELQKFSGVSKSVITPLFEKMLSASDAGRIGRLVLPKKCAEAYFPQILQPEGLPVKVQDVKGKEWVFQFRFWPNNHSRMYVLEGITPCIQSMQLQAGDIVTFSRLDPEGTLVMGGRKSLIPSSNQGDEVTIVGSDTSNLQDGSARNKYDDSISLNGHTQENILEDKPVIQSKRKNTRVAKGKRLRIVNEDTTDLKLTWKEAQGLMRPPAKFVPSIFVVEGCEFEEFEEVGPVIGRPTIYGIDHLSENIQWIQCEDCFKWRKVPANALLPSRWICSLNMWDLDRSQCSSAEELTKEQLEHMLPTSNNDSSKKEETTERSPNLYTLEGLDALANLAIEGENNSSTKHPRHKPGCTCIVCLQPPSGKGSKHEQPCDCAVCSALKRRFKTLMERRERKQIEMAEKVHDLDDTNGEDSFNSHVKGQIDLNVQPEREDGLSTGSESDGLSKCISENLFRQQDGIGGVSFISCLALDGDQ